MKGFRLNNKCFRKPLSLMDMTSSPIRIGNCEATIQAPNFSKVTISCRKQAEGGDFSFVLVNPKDAHSSTKSYLQEVLNMYIRELPTMNFAANTGKHSMFLERCVTNGKYCTLLLQSRSVSHSKEVIAAITYQIVPADTQYAEIPIAAVSSMYQHKGFGSSLFLELKKRLQSVGIRTIFCWGDKESEAFWLKQGFVSIAEVDTKGRRCRPPIKADIRRVLCFPGGSTLMILHLKQQASAITVDSLELGTFLKPQGKSSSSGALTREDSNKLVCGAKLSIIEDDGDINNCSSEQGKVAKRKVWKSSISSLKSKKVKGRHHQSESNSIDGSEFCLQGCSFVSSKDKSLLADPPRDWDSSCKEKIAEECGAVTMTLETSVQKEFQSQRESFKIMLMNIADDAKKANLKKVIEDLGGAVTCNGSTSTHVVTGKVRTTLNFCTALCSGAWIVSPSWLKESFRQGRYADELPYILHDEEYVVRYGAELSSAVLRARGSPQGLLKGYNVYIAAHVQPPAKMLSTIVKFSGGNIIDGLEKVNEASKTIFVACDEDMEDVVLAVKKGKCTFSSDWLMHCVMRQKLDLEAPQFVESL
uniref:uncharacterized protein LOC101291854 isoform X1 n=2 Tax=Fragaria vesca subsp. vesca TaxID=101020 RepID=UPI0005C9FF6C|nr:PREDICTED: uncharacterized protein LOC101291854 isoform X1 [Fragaria vesca subsp. vesca]